MKEHNRDMFPTDATIALLAQVKPLLANRIVDQAFRKREKAAVVAKARYHLWGRTALVLVALGAIYTIAKVLALPPFPGEHSVDIVIAALAVIGVALQIYIVASGNKKEWLLNRFGAERLRSIKFQGYHVAAAAADTGDLAARADAYYREAVVKLENELNSGVSALLDFSPRDALVIAASAAGPANPALEKVARDAYAELRITYQGRFAKSQLKALDERKRWIDTSADMIYLLAAASVALALLITAGALDFVPPLKTNVHIVEFIAVSLFIVSISKYVLESTSLFAQSKGRYERYVSQIEGVEEAMGGLPRPFHEIIDAMEQLALGELDDFCRSAESISYRL